MKRYHQAGLSLIELMIALLLGLVVTGAATSIFVANKRAYGSTETLSRLQENGRVAFEMMARDLREAGGNPCSSSLPIANVLNSHGTTWWTKWEDGISGYSGSTAAPGTVTGGGVAQRVAGTDAVDIHSAFDGDYRVIAKMPQPSANIEVSSVAGLKDGDILMICDHALSSIFQVTQLPAGDKIQHNSGNGAPGNCTKDFIVDPDKCNNSAVGYTYGDDAQVVLPVTLRWYIGNNANGGRSLYRARVLNRTVGEAPDLVEPVEVAEGVSDMDLTYLHRDATDYVQANAVTEWRNVVAVRIEVQLQAADGALQGDFVRGTDGQRLGRELSHVVTIRNRMP